MAGLTLRILEGDLPVRDADLAAPLELGRQDELAHDLYALLPFSRLRFHSPSQGKTPSSINSLRHAPTAPGTTVIAFSRSSARRSRLNPQTYSMDWKRGTHFCRFPTRALPETAPTRESK